MKSAKAILHRRLQMTSRTRTKPQSALDRRQHRREPIFAHELTRGKEAVRARVGELLEHVGPVGGGREKYRISFPAAAQRSR